MIEFENRVEYRSRANWRWCTESVRRNFHSVKSLCIPGNSRCVEFFSFFLYFFSTFHPRRHCFHGYLSSPPFLLVEEEEARTYTSGRRETRHWASDFAADFTRKSFFDFGPQRTVIQTTTILFDSQPGRVI